MATAPDKAANQAKPRESKTAVADAIKPQKQRFTWKSPFQYGYDFIKGTFTGMNEGLSKGAKLGLKIGLLVGVALFFAPVVPMIEALQVSMGLIEIGSGLGAFFAIGGYGLAGATVGAVGGGALGTLAGGGREMQYRFRREKYADAYADKLAIQEKRKTNNTPVIDWRVYAAAENEEQKRFFFQQREFERQANNSNQGLKTSWVDYAMESFNESGRHR